ncbi:hypothetical protein ODS41_02420 [Pyrobaculum sp. 3827-6]|uniref:hypothetical protein n=1 Tax=Pyrobaculum sp. 3827-6 TaxID=2983604 RepID=UPI0021D7E44C|nr:hypothetical protein [Pyrobaculum sp. 3827-6]MCU7786785.1 hypothetical protein [Pyrobaculum sp. 3827-6]
MGGLGGGLWGSVAVAVVILAVLGMVGLYGVFYRPALVLMTALVAIAVFVYLSFSSALGDRRFSLLGPPVIGLSAAGVALLWLGRPEGAGVVAAAYFGEPVLGYFVYRRLASIHRLWALVFLESAAAYAYSLPAVLLGLWAVPAAADLVKLAALLYFVRRV